jgi:hypothetical protein
MNPFSQAGSRKMRSVGLINRRSSAATERMRLYSALALWVCVRAPSSAYTSKPQHPYSSHSSKGLLRNQQYDMLFGSFAYVTLAMSSMRERN